MKCDNISQQIVDDLAGELDEKASAELQAHLKSCPSCREEFTALSRVWDATGRAFHSVQTKQAESLSQLRMDRILSEQKVSGNAVNPQSGWTLQDGNSTVWKKWFLQIAAMLLFCGILGYALLPSLTKQTVEVPVPTVLPNSVVEVCEKPEGYEEPTAPTEPQQRIPASTDAIEGISLLKEERKGLVNRPSSREEEPKDAVTECSAVMAADGETSAAPDSVTAGVEQAEKAIDEKKIAKSIAVPAAAAEVTVSELRRPPQTASTRAKGNSARVGKEKEAFSTHQMAIYQPPSSSNDTINSSNLALAPQERKKLEEMNHVEPDALFNAVLAKKEKLIEEQPNSLTPRGAMFNTRPMGRNTAANAVVKEVGTAPGSAVASGTGADDQAESVRIAHSALVDVTSFFRDQNESVYCVVFIMQNPFPESSGYTAHFHVEHARQIHVKKLVAKNGKDIGITALLYPVLNSTDKNPAYARFQITKGRPLILESDVRKQSLLTAYKDAPYSIRLAILNGLFSIPNKDAVLQNQLLQTALKGLIEAESSNESNLKWSSELLK